MHDFFARSERWVGINTLLDNNRPMVNAIMKPGATALRLYRVNKMGIHRHGNNVFISCVKYLYNG